MVETTYTYIYAVGSKNRARSNQAEPNSVIPHVDEAASQPQMSEIQIKKTLQIPLEQYSPDKSMNQSLDHINYQNHGSSRY